MAFPQEDSKDSAPPSALKVWERVLPDPAELDGKWPFRKRELLLGLAEDGRQVSLAPHCCNACQVLTVSLTNDYAVMPAYRKHGKNVLSLFQLSPESWDKTKQFLLPGKWQSFIKRIMCVYFFSARVK